VLLRDVGWLFAVETKRRIASSAYPFAMNQIVKGEGLRRMRIIALFIGSSLARGFRFDRFVSRKGNPARHRPLDDGCHGAAAVAESPAVFMIVRRVSGGTCRSWRQTLSSRPIYGASAAGAAVSEPSSSPGPKPVSLRTLLRGSGRRTHASHRQDDREPTLRESPGSRSDASRPGSLAGSSTPST
jgi:hypothetical protein